MQRALHHRIVLSLARQTTTGLLLKNPLFVQNNRCSHFYNEKMQPFALDIPNSLRRFYSSTARFKSRLFYKVPYLRGAKPGKRKKIIILGTGWSSMLFLKFLNPVLFEVAIVSPRNYFTFTPLLPAVSAGTLSPLSCIEPVRNFCRHDYRVITDFYEAVAEDIEFENNKIRCVTETGDAFDLNYDYLVIGIGADTNTLGIPGVEKYGLYLKEVEHAIRIRKSVMNHFERAALPSTCDEEKERLLHFVAVGGGPTGVETIAELSDFIREDMSKFFPNLISYVRLTLIEATGRLLPMFSPRVSDYAHRTLLQHGKINVLLHHSVTKIRQKSIEVQSRVKGQPKETFNFHYGLVLWAVGVGSTPLGRKIIEAIPEQQAFKTIQTDSQKELFRNKLSGFRLRIIGTTNVYAMGDCKQIMPLKLKEHADLFVQMNRGVIPGSEFFRKHQRELSKKFPQLHLKKYNFWKHPLRSSMNYTQLKDYLETIDGSWKSPAPTAQNARQEGLYLACAFNDYPTDDQARVEKVPVFVNNWWGSLAYVGHGRAVISMPKGLDIPGGWFKVWTCGRDCGREHVLAPGELLLIKKEQVMESEGNEEDEEVLVTAPLKKALNMRTIQPY